MVVDSSIGSGKQLQPKVETRPLGGKFNQSVGQKSSRLVNQGLDQGGHSREVTPGVTPGSRVVVPPFLAWLIKGNPWVVSISSLSILQTAYWLSTPGSLCYNLSWGCKLLNRLESGRSLFF